MLDIDARARLKAKIEQADLEPKEIGDEIGVSEQAVSSWFKKGQISMEHLIALTRLAGTTIDEILTGNAHNLSDDEARVLRKYRATTQIQKKQVETLLDTCGRENMQAVENYHSNVYMRQEYRRKHPS